MEKPRKTSRRQFLTLEFKKGSALNSQNLNGNPKNKKEETQLLLTPEGTLVEVNKTIVDKAKLGIKASNKDILSWTKSNQ